MITEEIYASILLNSIKGVTPAVYQSILETFGSAGQAVKEKPDEWNHVPALDVSQLEEIKKDFTRAQKSAEYDAKLVENEGISIYLKHFGPYPDLLREIFNAPPILYVRGEDIAVPRPAIALVGSRRCSYYGERSARQLSADLVAKGITTVSGLARGIDSCVHQSTLEAGGKTWAVIGNGLATIYPPENRKLAEKIVSNGALISEFPMTMKPYPANFPRRNRIIAGLSLGTVVVEGREKSGSLITAHLALDNGREVYAVPGPVSSEFSQAPHRLLKLGAKLVGNVDDIVSEIPESYKSLLKGTTFDKIFFNDRLPPAQYQEILNLLTAEPVSKEELAARLKKDATTLASVLLEMELGGWIKSISGGFLVRI